MICAYFAACQDVGNAYGEIMNKTLLAGCAVQTDGSFI